MMSEVLREGVRRLRASDNQEDSSLKIKVTIEVESYEIAAKHLYGLAQEHLDSSTELSFLEQQTGAKFILGEVLTTRQADDNLCFGTVLKRVNNQQKKLTTFNVHH